jgi:hypothetical protein
MGNGPPWQEKSWDLRLQGQSLPNLSTTQSLSDYSKGFFALVHDKDLTGGR